MITLYGDQKRIQARAFHDVIERQVAQTLAASFFRRTRSLPEGNVFSHVSLSVHKAGGRSQVNKFEQVHVLMGVPT